MLTCAFGFRISGSASLPALALVAACLWQPLVQANPVGPTVAGGSATFSSQGSQFTIRASNGAFLNWQSFNIGLGETTTFIEPSDASVVWNRINDSNPSQILGSLNANGYVVLQNQNGFYIGGQASISTHGLILTTAPIPTPDLSSGGAWQFNNPPPAASIVNYGQINMGRGGSAFLIADDVENHGAISTPQGSIGLYAGQQVLVCQRPDGRGLSAKVTLPQGSVNNSGQLIADAGQIAMTAQVVNQGGLLQADSLREINGVVQLVAGDAVNLGANSAIEARGGSTGTSPGGSVVIKSGGSFSDQPTSIINVSGGPQGGNGGNVEVSAANLSAINSRIDAHAAKGFLAGELTIDPENILLAGYGDSAPPSGTVNPGDPPSAGSADTLTLNVNSLNSLISQDLLSKINLQAIQDIEVGTLWNVPDSQNPNASLTLQAGRNITIDNGAGILAGRNWNLNFIAGTELTSAANKHAGQDGIYLTGSAFIQAQNGNVNLTAGNEVFVDDGIASGLDVDGNGIRTTAGGNINVTAAFGNVNCGANPAGYQFGLLAAPYYDVSPGLGGISTAAGGNVTVTAGGNITSYLPRQGNANDIYDGGSGAFGPEPGNVTLTAGGSIFGHYVVANGVGTVTAGANVGGPILNEGFALSLVKGSWNVYAPNGSIYLQEVRNPNGVLNGRGNPSRNPGLFYFDYDPLSSVLLQAADCVEVTGLGLPRPTDNSGSVIPAPIVFPPTLTVEAGPGGFILDHSITLFQSPYGNLNITTTGGGDFRGVADAAGDNTYLYMSDSPDPQWQQEGNTMDYKSAVHASVPPELNNPNPVVISVSGDVKTVDIYTTKETFLTVGGDMINSSFRGENLHPTDATSVNVAGQIYYTPNFNYAYLSQPIVASANIPPLLAQAYGWQSFFYAAVNPNVVAQYAVQAVTGSALRSEAQGLLLFQDFTQPNPGFTYNASTLRFGFSGPMNYSLYQELAGPLAAIQIGSDGLPEVVNGHFVTAPITFVDKSAIQTLYQESQSAPTTSANGLQIGGPGVFNVNAGSVELGYSQGIRSFGLGGVYTTLAPVTAVGAALNVTVAGDLDMLSSRICSMDGGNVTVTSAGGQMDLGAPDLLPQGSSSGLDAFGIYTSGHSDVFVTAHGDVNIDGSRIAAYDAGNVYVKSLYGNVDIGSGGADYVNVEFCSRDPMTGAALDTRAQVYGSGIVALSQPTSVQAAGGYTTPGNITVDAPRGDITSTQAGILQMALNGSTAGGPTITLTAGTAASGGSPAIPGNIYLGDSGLIGGTVNLTAQGSIQGLIVSRQTSTINAAQNFSGTLLSAGNANVSAGGTVSGTIIGITGANVSGGGGVSAAVLGQNVSIGGGPATSTLGTTAASTSTSQAAAQQASADTRQQLAGDSTDAAKADDLKKKLSQRPALRRRVGRVTVILPGY